MAEGNGADLGHIVAMLGDVLAGQETIRRDLSQLKDETQREFAAVRMDIALVKQDLTLVKQDMMLVKQDMMLVKRDLASVKQDVASVRQEVALYHSSVMGHGIALSELQARLQRVEEHLNLPPLTPH